MSNDIASWVLEGRNPTAEEMRHCLLDALQRSLGTSPQTREQVERDLVAQLNAFRVQAFNARISAAWLRECGVPVPANIPDCATIPATSVRFETSGPVEQGILSVGVAFDEPFEWFEATVTVDGTHGGREL